MKAKDLTVNCTYCGKRFLPSASARCRHKKHGTNIFCSRECHHMNSGHHFGKYNIKCKTCGKEMVSTYDGRKYCCLKCYMADPETKHRLEDMNLKKKKDAEVIKKCAYCGTVLHMKKSRESKRNYCNKVCSRAYMSERFDRFVVSEMSLGKINNYDEFLSKEILPCPVDGCDWEGEWLSSHMNFEHGIKKDDFKKMMGFNIKSAIMTSGLHLQFLNKDTTHLDQYKGKAIGNLKHKRKDNYYSSEASEHKSKEFALRENIKECVVCGEEFRITNFGNHRYCSVRCREKEYYKDKL